MLQPNRPLPEPLRGSDAGTFTEDSVIRRLPEIALKTLADNELAAEYAERVEQLADEITSGSITPIEEPEAADREEWADHVAGYAGQRWIDVPWFFAETYFYRRLLAATGFSQPGERKGVDPFASQKELGLDAATDLAVALSDVSDAPTLLGASLWANRVDLSLWRAGDGEDRTTSVLSRSGSSRLLVDNTLPAAAILDSPRVDVHIVLDNAGAELVADLAVAAHVLAQRGRVTLHAKPHPTFVSDTTLADLDGTIDWLESTAPPIATRLRAGARSGLLRSAAHPFWVSPLPFWNCPEDLVDDMAGADLVIVKGDANYRRLLGDLHWEPTTPFTEIVRPLQPLLALRTSKALVGAGIDAAIIKRARAEDPNWMTSGDWGMIQLADEIPSVEDDRLAPHQ
jgi:hypothetical protein